jgi:hypothetical protein
MGVAICDTERAMAMASNSRVTLPTDVVNRAFAA